LISRISAAKPKIADYPFTTITPNLGVVALNDGNSFVVADIPGLIEGAHEGTGLGHQFLRHIERTRLLVHVIDGTQLEGRDVIEDFKIITKELGHYNEKLARRPQIVVVNKIELPQAQENAERLIDYLKKEKPEIPYLTISAVTGKGIDQLLNLISRRLNEIEVEPIAPVFEEEVRIVEGPSAERFHIKFVNGLWEVTGEEIEKHIIMTDFSNEEAVKRLQRIIKLMGLEKALRDRGVKEGDTVRIKDMEFDFTDENF